MKIKEWYLTFDGTFGDAQRFINDMREMQNVTGLDYPKVFNDFLFAIEIAINNQKPD